MIKTPMLKSGVIDVKIFKDSITKIQGVEHRITTFSVNIPRFILAEMNTHRQFSRLSASSRAIPFAKTSESIKSQPMIPYYYQKKHKGMQGSEYITDLEAEREAHKKWLSSMHSSIKFATEMDELGVTKQITNRMLEPYQYHQVLITTTEIKNFFDQRCSKLNDDEYDIYKEWDWKSQLYKKLNGSSEIHMQMVANLMYHHYTSNIPDVLKPGEWHIPFSDNFKEDEVKQLSEELDIKPFDVKIRIATARCARISYNNFGGKSDYRDDIRLFNQLLNDKHMSPFEMCARAMTSDEYEAFVTKTPVNVVKGICNNYRGYVQLRWLIENSQKI